MLNNRNTIAGLLGSLLTLKPKEPSEITKVNRGY